MSSEVSLPPATRRASFLRHALHHRWRAAVEVAALVATAALVRWAFVKATPLPESAYEKPVLLWEAIRHPSPLLALLLPTAVLAWRSKELSWHKLELEPKLRWLLCALIVAIAWMSSVYGYNAYFDRAHALDRLLVAVLAVASCVNPVFTAPFVAFAAIVSHQLRYPLGAYAWADAAPLGHLLSLYVAALLLRTVHVPIAGRFLPVALVLHASHYVHSGFDKLLLGWPAREEFSSLFAAYYAVGWLVDVSSEGVARIAGALDVVNLPLVLSVLTLELAAVLVLLRRRLAILLLSALAAMHLGTFALSGIFFWQWILIDAGFALVLSHRGVSAKRPSFGSPGWLAGSAILILCARFLLPPVRLAWLDTRLCNFYRIDVVTTEGAVYEVARADMAPYDGLFTQGRLQYLDDAKLLVDTYGEARSVAVFEALRSVTTAAEVSRLESRLGHNAYNPALAGRFDDFMRTWFKTAPARRSSFDYLRPPSTSWSSPRGRRYQWDESVRSVHVRRIKVLWDGRASVVLSDQIIRRVRIN
jgi:hypothetical protein